MSRYNERVTALINACVLVGALRRNMLLSLADAGFFRPRWSVRILDETQRTISKITNNATNGVRQRKRIEATFPHCLVTGYESLMDDFSLPDPNDNHVLAAAIFASASVIVTDNLGDFPNEILVTHNINAISADSFIANLISLNPVRSLLVLKLMRERYKNPILDVSALIRIVEKQGLIHVAGLLNEHRASL